MVSRAQPYVPPSPALLLAPSSRCFSPELTSVCMLLRSPRSHLTLISAPADATWPAENGVRLRRTWRVTGNMGLTYEV